MWYDVSLNANVFIIRLNFDFNTTRYIRFVRYILCLLRITTPKAGKYHFMKISLTKKSLKRDVAFFMKKIAYIVLVDFFSHSKIHVISQSLYKCINCVIFKCEMIILTIK